ncbi:SBBP repeat-containing protein [Gloeobacter morelensis]|uniref:SBBP repeat-containing protein n=1 Tax=Gloeobacter morelensis MG652769 TaxID=2781736 RepID=A0ABY3PGM1_9CYAN|nr:SBBP repeat-containing protein [Gloeobacter morelensis]UFP92794.1 SBBP repeat-containing protein [Gloeobacter morelensis MG652769]
MKFGLQLFNLTLPVALALSLSLAHRPQPVGALENAGTPSEAPQVVFEANKGQSAPQVKFLSRHRDSSLFLTAAEAVVALRINEKTGAALRLRWLGANPNLQMVGVQPQAGVSNYYLGSDPQRWQTNVGHYAKVQYRSVYPGIDMVWYGQKRELEYDFVVQPGADLRAIRLELQGAERLELDKQGDLLLRLPGGATLKQPRPLVYQQVNGKRRAVEGRYVLAGRQTIGFVVGRYDRTQPLVIDPVLRYSTYLGGSGEDLGDALAVDRTGSVYVTGESFSADFPTTAGAYQLSPAGGGDVFVTKLNGTGSALVYSTFIGGSASEVGERVVVDRQGNAYVGGTTASPNFPTTNGAYQTASGGGEDAFIAKLDASGGALVYSTYLGGSADDAGDEIALDRAGSVLVAGVTASGDFPVSAGAFQSTPGGGEDAFVAKLNPAGSALVYSTLLGGSEDDVADAIDLDSEGNAVVTGVTASPDFPLSTRALQRRLRGDTDAFVSRFNADGSALVFSTYLGGNADEEGDEIGVDSAGNVYITGITNSANFPTTPGSYQGTIGGGEDAFVAKLNPAGTALVYSTFLGGSADDAGDGIAVDQAGNVYLTGQTFSADFPVTADAFQPTIGGGEDSFVTKLSTTGASLVYSTFLGGSGSDSADEIVVQAGNAFVTGSTDSPDFPTTPRAYQKALSGGSDAFVVKITDPAP